MELHSNIEPVSCEELVALHISKTNLDFIYNEYGRDETRDFAIRKMITDIFASVIKHPDVCVYTRKPFHYRFQYFKTTDFKKSKLIEELTEALLRGQEQPIYFDKKELVRAFGYYADNLPEADSLPVRSQQADTMLWFDFAARLKQIERDWLNGLGAAPDEEDEIDATEHARQWRELAATLKRREQRAALAAACKWEGMTHIEAYDTIYSGCIKDFGKNERISKLKPVAQELAEKHGLSLSEWRVF